MRRARIPANGDDHGEGLWVVPGIDQHLLVVPTQSYHLAAPAEIHDRLENAPAIGPPADVVAEEDEGVLLVRLH